MSEEQTKFEFGPDCLTKASLVLIGTVNIYIFQPGWIAEVMGRDGGAAEFQVDLNRPGLKVSKHQDGCDWTIRPDRLMLETRKSDTDLGEIAAKVLDRLPETPWMAMGQNFHFRCHKSWATSEVLNRIAAPKIESGEVTKSSYVVSIRNGGRVINLAIHETDDEQIELVANVHFQLGTSKVAEKVAAAKSFLGNRDEVIQSAKELWESR